MAKKAIKIACTGAGTIALKMMTPLQGRLKVLTEENYLKFKNELQHDGFIEPISVWEDPASANLYILNGHQRFETLRRMEAEGFTIPQLPVNYVEASDLKNAKQKILALASQYGVVDQEGLLDFVTDAGLDAEEIRSRFEFSDFDTERFLKEHFRDEVMPSVSIGDSEPPMNHGQGDSPARAPGPTPEAIGSSQPDAPKAQNQPAPPAKKSSEVLASDFHHFAHRCPRCSFEFD